MHFCGSEIFCAVPVLNETVTVINTVINTVILEVGSATLHPL